MKLVFFGTPEFAVPALKALHAAEDMEVLAVVTAADKPAGRGQQLRQSAVKQCALELEIPVLQPEKLRDPSFLEELYRLQADIYVVIAFRMLPEIIWNHPLLGTINLHASLLPKYRGAAPINWAIINGESETGITTFRLKHEIDTGNILLQEKFPILKEETAGSLYLKLCEAGAPLVLKTLRVIADGSLEEKEQQYSSDTPHAPKLNKETGLIQWNSSARHIEQLIRGLNPMPSAWTQIDGKILKIHRALIGENCAGTDPASLRYQKGKNLLVACADHWLELIEVQPEGKRAMSCEEWLRGYTPKAVKMG